MATSRRFLSGLASAAPALSPETSVTLTRNTTSNISRIKYRDIMHAPSRIFFNLRLLGCKDISKLGNHCRLELEQFVDDLLHFFAGERVNIQVGLLGLHQEFRVAESVHTRAAKNLEPIFRSAGRGDIHSHDGRRVDGAGF